MSKHPNQDGAQASTAILRGVVIISLALVMITLCYWYYHEIITWFPSHIHAWTQSDRLALAYGYLENGFDFFTPRTYNLHTSDGITGVDFPIHEYVVALLMKLFGTNEPFVFRAYTLGYSLTGYVFLYLLARKITRRDILAAIVVLFAFTSPIITYYQAGFIPSATSLASSFIGCYFFFRYKDKSRHTDLYWAIGFMTLAALPRPSANILLFTVLLLESYGWLRARKIDKKAFLGFAFVYALIGVALMYKNYLNAEYGARFLTSLMPANDMDQFIGLLKETWSRWHFQLLTKYHWALLGISITGTAVALMRSKVRPLDKAMLLMSTLLFAGSAIFYVALARQFIAHEYYFMDSLYLAIFLLLIPGLRFVSDSSRIARIAAPVLFAVLIFGAAYDSMTIQEEKYALTDWDRGEVTRKNFTGADIFLDQLDIPRDAKILVFEAYSTNAPLLLMGRRGYTILNSRDEAVQLALKLDFDYIAVQDVYLSSDLLYNSPWTAYNLLRRGGNGRISVFTYHPEMGPGMPYPIQGRIAGLLGLDTVLFQRKLVMDTKSIIKSDSINLTVTEIAGDSLNGLEPHESVAIAISSDPDTDVRKEVVRLSPAIIVDRIDSTVEFGGSLVLPLSEFNGADRILIDIAFDGRGIDDMPEGKYEFDVVLSIESPSDQKQYYKSFRVKRGKAFEVFYGYTCLFEIPELQQEDLRMKCYIWNRFKKDLDIKAVTFKGYKFDDITN